MGFDSDKNRTDYNSQWERRETRTIVNEDKRLCFGGIAEVFRFQVVWREILTS